jgi:hypothetical protein
MRRALLLCALLSTSAIAAIGPLEETPAATLLIPYFEVDLANATGRNTVIQVRGPTASGTLVHATLWTDRGVPVFGFDFYLTGYDSQTIDLRQVLAGTLPSTATQGQDPNDTISPQGDQSQDINFASCTGTLPPQPVPASTTDAIKAALTGKTSPLLQGNCGGRDFADQIARGFLTFDVTSACTTLHPTSPTYFPNIGVASNRITGGVAYVNPSTKTTRTLAAVHLEATDDTNDLPSRRSFYGKFSNGADRREPLARTWHAPFRKGASLIAWRDNDWTGTSWACTTPRAEAKRHRSFMQWDTQEQAEDLTALTLFGSGSTLVTIGSELLPVTARSGFFNWNSAEQDDELSQGWLGTLEAAEGGEFRTGVMGTPFDSAAIPDPNDDAWGMSSTFRYGAVRSMDPSPAASLLLPFFEVDLADANKSNTLVRVTNTVADAVLVNVTFWTDLGVPSANFPMYLTGFDQAELDLRMLFSQGLFARTGSAGQDPSRDISPQGNFSQDINFASCTGRLPGSRLTEVQRAALRNAHLGLASTLFQGQCGASPATGQVARGYVTFDLVVQCNPGLPTSAGYAGNLDQRNTITGDFVLTSRTDKTAVGDALVPIHGRNNGHPALAGTAPRFYGRFHNHTGISRQPLPSLWEVPYDQTNGGSTSLLVWREPSATAAPFVCGQTPTGQPGAFEQLWAFDDQEEVTAITGAHFRTVSSRVSVGVGGLAVPYQKGFLVLDLDDAAGGTGGPPGSPTARQAFVMSLRSDATGGTGWVQRGFPALPEDPPTRTGIVVDDEIGVVVPPAVSARFTVRILGTAPTANVSIPLSTPPGITATPSTVVITPATASTGVVVTVTGTINAQALREFIVNLNTTTSTDTAFNTLDPVDAVVRIQNN